jgi:hypothetical protein
MLGIVRAVRGVSNSRLARVARLRVFSRRFEDWVAKVATGLDSQWIQVEHNVVGGSPVGSAPSTDFRPGDDSC